jgi:hypothetical protein
MKTLIRIWLFAVLGGSGITTHAQSGAQLAVPDPLVEAQNLVNDVLQLPASSHVSFYEQRARALGDMVAVAVARLMTPKDLQNGDNAKRVLTLLQDAFSDSSFIKDEHHRTPGVTLFVMTYIVEHSTDPATRERAHGLRTKLEALRVAH